MNERAILLVEDNLDDVALTLRALRKAHVANEVIQASDGAAALGALYGSTKQGAVALEPLPDLVLLDLKLPKVSGLEVLRRIRSEARTRFLPVVVLTSSNEEHDLVQSYTLGANSYIRKPVDFDEFLETVRLVTTYWLRLNLVPRG